MPMVHRFYKVQARWASVRNVEVLPTTMNCQKQRLYLHGYLRASRGHNCPRKSIHHNQYPRSQFAYHEQLSQTSYAQAEMKCTLRSQRRYPLETKLSVNLQTFSLTPSQNTIHKRLTLYSLHHTLSVQGP